MTLQTKLFKYDKITDCVSLHLRCLRHGKYCHYEELLNMNLNLEKQLSNIVGNCTNNKFKERSKNITMVAFMKATFFNQTTNIPGNDKYNERKKVVNDKLQTSKDKPHKIFEKSLLEDKETIENKSDSETDPKVTPHNVDEETNIQDSRSGELPKKMWILKNNEIDNKDNRSKELRSKDIDSENNSDTNNSNISSEQLSAEDVEVIRNNTDVETDPIVSPDNDEEESTNKDNISELQTNNDEEGNIVDNMNNDDNQDESTNTQIK